MQNASVGGIYWSDLHYLVNNSCVTVTTELKTSGKTFIFAKKNYTQTKDLQDIDKNTESINA